MSLKLNGEGAAEDRLAIVGVSAFGTGEVPASWSRSSLVSSSPPDIVGFFSFAVGDGLFLSPFTMVMMRVGGRQKLFSRDRNSRRVWYWTYENDQESPRVDCVAAEDKVGGTELLAEKHTGSDNFWSDSLFYTDKETG